METTKKWLLVLGMGTTLLFGSCRLNLGRSLYDSAVEGTSDFVRNTAFDFLTDNVGGFLNNNDAPAV